MKRNLIATILSLVFLNTYLLDAQFQSTVTGGAWRDTLTWVWNEVPDSNDVVVVNGPVQVDAGRCRLLTIMPGASLTQEYLRGSGSLEVYGGVENYGTISDASNTYLFLTIRGDIYNAGIWTNNRITLKGKVDQHLSCAPEKIFASPYLTSADSLGLLYADSNMTFYRTDFDLGRSLLVLPSGGKISLTGADVIVKNGKIQANGSEIYQLGAGSYFENLEIENAIISGQTNVRGNVVFTGVTINRGFLTQWPYDYYTILIKGSFKNEGITRNHPNGGRLTLDIWGNIINDGIWTNGRTILDGWQSQTTIEIRRNLTLKGIVEFDASTTIYSTYQWRKNEVNLEGKTNRILTFDSLNTESAGVYDCILDGVMFSRTFVVTASSTSVEETMQKNAPVETILLRNYPNPFNPSTNFEFSAPIKGQAKLSIHNMLGQEITTVFENVVEQRILYSVKFDASQLPSGIYFSRFTVGSISRVNKIILLK